MRLSQLHWTGDELLAFGGGTYEQPTSDAAAYAPSRGTWRPIPIPPFEDGRLRFVAGNAFSVGRRTVILVQDGGQLLGLMHDGDTDVWSWHAARPGPRENQVLAFAHGTEVVVGRRELDEATGLIDAFNLDTGRWETRRDTRFGDGPQLCGARALPTTAGAVVSFCDRLYAYDAATDAWTQLVTPSLADAQLPPVIVGADEGTSYGLEWDEHDVPTLTRLTVTTR
jgi:hypothetical protein